MKDWDFTKNCLEAYIRELKAEKVSEEQLVPCEKLLSELENGNTEYAEACLEIMIKANEQRIKSGEFIID